jgi:hypothetical protein
MTMEIAGRLGISGVEEPMDQLGFTMALAGCTLENVGFAAINILNSRSGLEEHIDRCVPFLNKRFCKGSH